MSSKHLLAWLPLVLLPASCVVDNSPPRVVEVDPSGGPVVTTPSTSTSELLVDVDTNQVMTATGGGGVGVFVEYKAGGHWHVYWTCDSTVNPSASTCDFDLRLSTNAGNIGNVAAQGSVNPGMGGSPSLEIQSAVTTELDGITFDTPAGAVVTIDALVAGTRDGRLFFFVQNGVVDGNVDTTRLSDPMMFHGSMP
jgi:hypothetical protein